jgi:hypothetical protein
MSYELLTRKLHCTNCGTRGEFTYEEANSPYMGGGMTNERVSEGFKITNNTGIAISSEIACANCGQIVKEGVSLGSAPLPSSPKSRSRRKRRG